MTTNSCATPGRSPLTDAVPDAMFASTRYSSRPRYLSLTPDAAGSQHLLVIEAGTLAEGQADELSKAFAPVADRLQVLVTGAAVNIPGATAYADLDATLHALRHGLQLATMGHRVYIHGTEPYVWSVYTQLMPLGLDRHQISMSHGGSLKRRVWCTHCHSLTENVTTNIVPCGGCGRHLLVRDHFSRRFGAYMGVQIDAEVPGVRPAIEEVFP